MSNNVGRRERPPRPGRRSPHDRRPDGRGVDDLYWLGVVVAGAAIYGVQRSWPTIEAEVAAWLERWSPTVRSWAVTASVAVLATGLTVVAVRRHRQEVRARATRRLTEAVRQADRRLVSAEVRVVRWRVTRPRNVSVRDHTLDAAPRSARSGLVTSTASALGAATGGEWRPRRARRGRPLVLVWTPDVQPVPPSPAAAATDDEPSPQPR